MTSVVTIGLDIAKSVFHVHGVDAAGQAVVRQRLTRRRVLAFFEKLPSCLVGIEACSSSHYWARELTARGHEVRLMPAQYVKAYVKRGKNDAADAEAICEAVTRPTMRFVPVKTPEQQSVMMLHRVRLMLNRQCTQLSNSIRSHLSEFGIVAPIGRRGLDQLLAMVAGEKDARVPADARLCLKMLAAQLIVVKQQILENDRRVRASARATDIGRRLMEIPGVGPLLASAFVATIADRYAFKTGRGGSDGCDPLRRAAWNAPSLARSVDAAPLNKSRRGCARKQNGAYRLGVDDKRRALSRARYCNWHSRVGIGAARRLRGW